MAALSSADLVTTDDIEAMRDYIIRHAEAIYRNCHRRLGTDDSLYIITGCIKTDLWALATYQEVEAHGSDDIRVLELSRRAAAARTPSRPSSAYRWTQHPTATYRDHDDSGVEGLKNQSLFLQGFKLAFSDQFICRMRKGLHASTQNSSRPAAGQGPLDNSTQDSAGSRGGGYNPSQSGGYEPNDRGSTSGTRRLSTQISPTRSHEALDGPGQDARFSFAGRSRDEDITTEDSTRELKFSQFPAPPQNVSGLLFLGAKYDM